ncbi:MAG: HD domain-containing protein [Campylobacterota bacterium]|nr:HD domain-containing protein [Campylobacterota bacterium]
MRNIPKIIQTISQTLIDHNAKAIIVGGSIRDHLLNLPLKDYDIEVYGLQSLEELETILSHYGSVNLVGKSFGILKFSYGGDEYDFSFPRLEQKIGEGHRGFSVACDGDLPFEQASLRRDFTINAMGYDIESGLLLDPYGAREDMRNRTLRHINSDSFVEDPLRVYRAVQFCARFGYRLAEETMLLCQQMVESGMLEELPKERVYSEWIKLLLKSPKPSIGFELMHKLGILRYFPELQAIIGLPQSPKWHPEGDVWVHTMMSIDAMAGLRLGDERVDLKLMFAVLCHDLGKATTTTIEEDGRIRSIGHEREGIKPTKSLLYRLCCEHNFIDSLLPLVQYHLAPSQLYVNNSKDRAVRRLSTKVTISELIIVAKADFLGRTTESARSGIYEAGEWLLEKAKNLKVQEEPPQSIIQGRDLIGLGFEPSPRFKDILASVYSLQIEGKITDREEALRFVKEEFLP